MKKYLTTISAAMLTLLLTAALQTSAFAASKTAKVSVDEANLRLKATTTSDIVATLKKGEQVTINATEGDWYKVSANGKKGYIRSDKVKISSSSSSSTNAAKSSSATVKVDNANLRAAPSTDAKVVTTVPAGAKVTIKDQQGDWYKVTVNSKTGYLRSDLLSQSSSKSTETKNASSSGSNLTGKTVKAAVDDLNLRETPSTDASVVNTLGIGTKLKILDVKDDWYKVSYDSQNGYVRNDKVTLVTDAKSSSDTTKTAATTQETSEAQKTVNANVQSIQTLLTELKFYSGKIDGNLGNITLAALKSYQRAYGLSIDGQAGQETLGSLEQAVATGGNGTDAGQIAVNEEVYLAEWFNYMKAHVPKHTPLRCVDVQTGEAFYLSAFSLGNHADVEPSTKNDTDTLYRINGNKWAWTPRAIWVYIDDKCYAAAINMMPHGGQTIKDNGMDGQICMHFLHSRQHNTGRENNNLQTAVIQAFDNAKNAPKVGQTGPGNAVEGLIDEMIESPDDIVTGNTGLEDELIEES